jgi:GNAT superfamily N-acetyltransferase
MATTIEIRVLAPDDDRSGFSCGRESLDRFFEHYADLNRFQQQPAVTYVAAFEGRILGFSTIIAASLERAITPGTRLRRRLSAYPLPVVRLARLGVDSRAQGLGIGKALLSHVFALALEQRNLSGCVGVVTDATVEAVRFYEALGFVPLEGVRKGQLAGEPLPMFLSVDSIAAASSG